MAGVNSIKARIIARLLALCEPLKSEGRFRVVARVSAPFITAAVKPAIHVVIGNEIMQGEDQRGYSMEFPVIFELIVEDARDPFGLADASVAYLQEKIESDLQLAGLASAVIYDGELPYTTETTLPVGATWVTYLIRYRRPRAQPEINY